MKRPILYAAAVATLLAGVAVAGTTPEPDPAATQGDAPSKLARRSEYEGDDGQADRSGQYEREHDSERERHVARHEDDHEPAHERECEREHEDEHDED